MPPSFKTQTNQDNRSSNTLDPIELSAQLAKAVLEELKKSQSLDTEIKAIKYDLETFDKAMEETAFTLSSTNIILSSLLIALMDKAGLTKQDIHNGFESYTKKIGYSSLPINNFSKLVDVVCGDMKMSDIEDEEEEDYDDK